MGVRNMKKIGFTLIEMLIVILIGVLIIGVMVGLYVAHQRVQGPIKMTSDITEIQRAGIAQLEWIFSRWGTGTPCNDPTRANICTRIRPCDINGNFSYPPPSSLCVSIRSGSPCGEMWFYANLEGVGIISNVYRDEVRLVSCRLRTDENNNCFHIMRYGRFFRDANNNAIALIFRLTGLAPQNAECLDARYLNPAEYNARASRTATIYNGNIINQQGQPQDWLLLEGGDIIIRVPKRVHLYCGTGPDNRLWLKMDLTDMAENCTANEPSINISPVESFRPFIMIPIGGGNEIVDNTFGRNNPQSNSTYLNSPLGVIGVEINFRNFENPNSPNYRNYRIIRYFGR
jgi:type II secretory pathway pseudopilin PulG